MVWSEDGVTVTLTGEEMLNVSSNYERLRKKLSDAEDKNTRLQKQLDEALLADSHQVRNAALLNQLTDMKDSESQCIQRLESLLRDCYVVFGNFSRHDRTGLDKRIDELRPKNVPVARADFL